MMSVRDIYDDVRPLLILCKITGMTNLKNVFSGRLEFRWDVNCLWPFVLYVIQSYIVCWSVLESNAPVRWYWTIDSILRELCRLLTTLYSDKWLPNIIVNIYRFDIEHGRPLKHQKTPRYFVVAYVLLTLCTYVCAIVDVATHGLSMKSLSESVIRELQILPLAIIFLIHAWISYCNEVYVSVILISRYITSIFPLMYLFFCDELCTRFQSLRTRWRNEVARILEAGPGIFNQKMESERLAHAKLCDLINDVQKAFGSRLTTYLLFMFLDHLARFYFLTYVKPAFLASHPGLQSSFVKDFEPFLFLAHTWTGTYLIAYMSDFLTESSKSILTDLRNIPLWKLPKECSEQVSFFMSQVQCSNTEMTASGLFVVDKTLLSSIVMSLATYIIVLIQLSPDLGRVFIEN